MIEAAALALILLLLPCGNSQSAGPDPEDFPFGKLEKELFGTPSTPKSYASYPSCDDTLAELSDGRRDKPWNIPSNFYENATVTKSGATMYVSIIPNRLMGIDSRSQSMTVVAEIMVSWIDCRLIYKNNSGMSPIAIPPYAIMWKPQLILDENFDTPLNFDQSILTVNKQGRVRAFLPQKVVTITCKLQLASYPFDTQKCSFSFRSTMYDTRYLSVKGDETTLNNHDPEMNSNMWEFINLTWKETSEHETLGMPPFCRVQVSLTVRRLPLFHLFNLVLPNTLLIVLCCVVFALPASDCGTEINMAVTILLAIVVFMLILYDQLPQTGDVIALLSLYFAGCMVLVTLSCLCSICTTLIGDMSTVESVRKVPRFLHVLGFHYVGPFLIPYTFKHLKKQHQDCIEKEDDDNNNNNSQTHSHLESSNGKTETDASKAGDSCCCTFLHMKDVSQWQVLSEVADRIFFLLFVLSTVTCITAFLGSGYASYHKEVNE